MKLMNLNNDLKDINSARHGIRVLLVQECDLSSIPDVVLYPSDTFAMFYKSDWLNDELIRRAINDIDRKDIKCDEDVTRALRERYLIEPTMLSTGLKNIVLCKFLNYVNRLCYMGTNCYRFLAEIAKDKEVVMVMEDYMDLTMDCFKDTIFRIGKDDTEYSNIGFNSRLVDLIDEEGIFQ